MISFNGATQEITVSTDTTITMLALYSSARAWEDGDTEMQYHHVFDVSSELLFTLRYGWKLKPSGYSAGTIIKINGKLTTTEGDGVSKVVPATTGSQVTWQFDTPATAVIVPVGGTVNVWHEPPTVEEIAAGVASGSESPYLNAGDMSFPS